MKRAMVGLLLALVMVPAKTGLVQTEVGFWGPGDDRMVFYIEQRGMYRSATIHAIDRHAVDIVHFSNLKKQDLKDLKDVIDYTIERLED